MDYTYITPLQGSLIVTDDFHSRDSLLRNKDFYKFIWVREGSIDIEIDHVGIHLEKNQVIPLSNLHHITFTRHQQGHGGITVFRSVKIGHVPIRGNAT